MKASRGAGMDRNKIVNINCLSADCRDLWSQCVTSWSIKSDFQRHLSCGYGSLWYLSCSCLHHAPAIRGLSPTPPPSAASVWFKYSAPLMPPPPLPVNHLSICTSAFHWGLHVSEDLNALNAGTSTVSLWHLTQRLGDLKGRGENYSKWSVTEIKNHPRLPPITLNDDVQSICWSDGIVCRQCKYQVKCEGDSLRETGTLPLNYAMMVWTTQYVSAGILYIIMHLSIIAVLFQTTCILLEWRHVCFGLLVSY